MRLFAQVDSSVRQLWSRGERWMFWCCTLWIHRSFPRLIVLKSSPIYEPFSNEIQTVRSSPPRETYQPSGGNKGVLQ